MFSKLKELKKNKVSLKVVWKFYGRGQREKKKEGEIFEIKCWIQKDEMGEEHKVHNMFVKMGGCCFQYYSCASIMHMIHSSLPHAKALFSSSPSSYSLYYRHLTCFSVKKKQKHIIITLLISTIYLLHSTHQKLTHTQLFH